MAPTATSSDLRQEVRRTLALQKPQLLEAWNKLDSSGFEPASKLDLQAAVIDQLYSGTGVSDDLMQQQNHSGSLEESGEQTETASPASSPNTFKQAVEGLPSNSQHNEKTDYEHRLAAVELAFKEHKHRLKVRDKKAEAVALTG